MPNAFVHIELNTTDVAKAKSFYGQLFDWKLDDSPMPDGTSYTMLSADEGPGGGMLKHPMGGPSIWIPYVLVDDVHASTAKAKSLGGVVIRDVSEVAGTGWFSIILDPTGAAIALWKAAPRTS